MTDADYELLEYEIRVARRANPGVSHVRLIDIVTDFSFPTRSYYPHRKYYESNEPKHKLSDEDLLKAFRNYNSRR